MTIDFLSLTFPMIIGNFIIDDLSFIVLTEVFETFVKGINREDCHECYCILTEYEKMLKLSGENYCTYG